MSPDELVEREAARVLDLLDDGDRMWLVSDRTRREKAAAQGARRADMALEWGHLFSLLTVAALAASFGFIAGLWWSP